MSNENFVEPRDVAFVPNAALRVPERAGILIQDLATSVGGADLEGRNTMLECPPLTEYNRRRGSGRSELSREQVQGSVVPSRFAIADGPSFSSLIELSHLVRIDGAFVAFVDALGLRFGDAFELAFAGETRLAQE